MSAGCGPAGDRVENVKNGSGAGVGEEPGEKRQQQRGGRALRGKLASAADEMSERWRSGLWCFCSVVGTTYSQEPLGRLPTKHKFSLSVTKQQA